MAELIETYWTLVPDYAQIVGRDGSLLTVEPRDAQDSVTINGRRWPVDPWGRVTMVQPDMNDAVVTLMLAFPGSTVEVVQ